MKLRGLLVAAALLVLPGLAACSSDDPKVATGASSTTTAKPAGNGGGANGGGANGKPTTTKKKSTDPNCGLLDKWSTAFLYAGKGNTTPTTANPIKTLDDVTAQLTAAVPSIAPAVQTRVALLKKKVGGQALTDQEKKDDTAAAQKMGEWKSQTCK